MKPSAGTFLAERALLPETQVRAMFEELCPFCTLQANRIVGENQHALWIRDAYPISPGHSLVIPKRHFGSYFEVTSDEQGCLLALLEEAKAGAEAEFGPDGFNIGINDGPAAGQTVQHLHIHLIPRFKGDLPDPRGGVRWVIPSKADYWTKQVVLTVTHRHHRGRLARRCACPACSTAPSGWACARAEASLQMLAVPPGTASICA